MKNKRIKKLKAKKDFGIGICELPSCSVAFKRKRLKQRYHSPVCKNTHYWILHPELKPHGKVMNLGEI